MLTERAFDVRKSELLYPATTMAAQQEESLLSRCEIPIIDLAHIGEHLHPTVCNLHHSAACAALISESAALNTTTLPIHLTIHSLGKTLYC